MQLAPRTLKRVGGWAFGPSSRRALAVVACALALAGCGSSAAVYPSFLPKKTLDPKVDAVLTGTYARPALQVEGLPVKVETSAFRVRITVSGPVVPGEGLPNQPTATTCTRRVRCSDHPKARLATARTMCRIGHLLSGQHHRRCNVPALLITSKTSE